LHVLEHLGGPEERRRSERAESFSLADVRDLNLMGLEVACEPEALRVPCRGSLPDHAFEHDGQLTKQDVRALTLSALAPHPGQLLWDVGAGAGSVAIEWLLSHPACRAIAIERDPVRCARIQRNAETLGVPALQLVEAQAPDGLDALPAPDAIFIGGGGRDPRLFELCHARLARGGTLVMNSVSLETDALLYALHARHGGELRRYTVESVAPLGGVTCFRPALPVTQWRLVKP
jgi:precorrin-6Y C5,15-methyltransferase (decarboxylating)